jgi:hypothetical protein
MKIITGQIPYSYLDNDAKVLVQVCAGVKPQQPSTNMQQQYWDFLIRCWSEEPGARPDIREVSSAVDIFFRESQGEAGLLEEGKTSVGRSDDERRDQLDVAHRDNRSFIFRAISRFYGQMMRLVT